MSWIAAGVVTAAACVGFALWWRRGFLQARPIELWGVEHAGPRAVAEVAGAAIGLAPERLADGWDWLVDLALAPVWFFWGDLRTRRPARQLRRWRLVGQHDGRAARVRFDDDSIELGLETPSTAVLWAVPPAQQPFADQEGLRALLPQGGPRWQAGTALLSAAFSLGVTRVALADGTVTARLPLATPPTHWPPLLTTLTRLGDLLSPTT